MSCLTGFSALMLTFSWSVTSSQAVYFQLFQHRLSPQKLRRGKPVVGCGRSHRLFNPAPPEVADSCLRGTRSKLTRSQCACLPSNLANRFEKLIHVLARAK